jgi:hypothetical protein
MLGFCLCFLIVPPLRGGPSLDFQRAIEMEHCTDKGSSEYNVTMANHCQ